MGEDKLIERGDIYYIKSKGRKPVGSEQSADRPAVIYNYDYKSGLAIILYITSRKNEKPIVLHSCRIDPSYVVYSQIYTVSQHRFGQKLGHITEEEQLKIDKRLLKTLGFGSYEEIEKLFRSFW